MKRESDDQYSNFTWALNVILMHFICSNTNWMKNWRVHTVKSYRENQSILLLLKFMLLNFSEKL